MTAPRTQPSGGGAAGLQEGSATAAAAGASPEARAAVEELLRAHARELWRATGGQRLAIGERAALLSTFAGPQQGAEARRPHAPARASVPLLMPLLMPLSGAGGLARPAAFACRLRRAFAVLHAWTCQAGGSACRVGSACQCRALTTHRPPLQTSTLSAASCARCRTTSTRRVPCWRHPGCRHQPRPGCIARLKGTVRCVP